MFKIFLKLAFRTLKRQQVYAFISILGLGTGTAVLLLIAMYIDDELKYDKHHANYSNIYRLVYIYNKDGLGEESAVSPFMLGPTIESQYPDIVESSVRLFNFQLNTQLVEGPKAKKYESGFYYTDQSVFEVFTIPLITKVSETPLNSPYQVVISEKAAMEYFGTTDVLLQKITVEEGLELVITGVFQSFPPQSHFQADFLASLSSTKLQDNNNWLWNACWTYLKIKDPARLHELQSNFPNIVSTYFVGAEKEYISLRLQPLSRIHLYSKLTYELQRNSNINHLYVLGGIGIAVFLIAFINFLNLTTTSSTRRAREIGIKKINGATRTQIVIQFLVEGIIFSMLALLLALVLIEISLPFFNAYTQKHINIFSFFQLHIFFTAIGMMFLSGILGSLYPVLYISALNPHHILKGLYLKNTVSLRLTRVLVFTQFMLSIVLLIMALFNLKQILYVQNADLGFNHDKIVVLPIYNTPILDEYDDFRDELKKSKNIANSTAMREIIGVSHNTAKFTPYGFAAGKAQYYPDMMVWYGFHETFDIKLLAGRVFDENNKSDLTDAVIINRELAQHLGYTDFEAILGKTFHSFDGNERIIGVTENININSLHSKVGPFVMHMGGGKLSFNAKYMGIKLIDGYELEGLKDLKKAWNKFVPERPFTYSFLEDELMKLYLPEKVISGLSMIFTMLALLIASMGILGLTSFLTELRTREIAIRKVLGGTLVDILQLYAKEFTRLVLLANLLAYPISYLSVTAWFDIYAYRTSIDILSFVVSSLVATGFIFGAIVYQSYKAMQMNTLTAIKYE